MFLLCSIFENDRPTRGLAYADTEADGEAGRCRRQEGAHNACPGAK